MADNILKAPVDPKRLLEDDKIEQLSKAIININQTVQTIAFVIDYLVEKYNVDVDDLQNYLDKRMKEYIEKLKEQAKAANIVIPD